MTATRLVAVGVVWAAMLAAMAGCEKEPPPPSRLPGPYAATRPAASKPVASATAATEGVASLPAVSAPSGPTTVDGALNLWLSARQDDAVAEYLAVDWQSPARFAPGSLLSTTERQLVAASTMERIRLSREVGDASRDLDALSRHVLMAGERAMAEKSYPLAERYFQAVLGCASSFADNAEAMPVVRIINRGLQRKVLQDLVNLYQATGDQTKLQAAQAALEEASRTPAAPAGG